METKTERHFDLDLGTPALGQETMRGKTSGKTHCISLHFMRKLHIKILWTPWVRQSHIKPFVRR